MRIALISLVVFLVACNGSSNSVSGGAPTITQADIQAAVAPLQERVTKAEAAASKANAALAKIQLFADVHNGLSLDAGTNLNAIDFGPCPDAGVKIGGSFKNGSGPLDEQTQAFKQTKTDICPGIYAEYNVSDGSLHAAPRVYFVSTDCSGLPLVWDAGGQGYDRQKLEAGISFISPADGLNYWVAPGTQPIMTQVESAFIVADGDCEVDGDFQPMWQAVQTTTSVSGVPLGLGTDYQVTGP